MTHPSNKQQMQRPTDTASTDTASTGKASDVPDETVHLPDAIVNREQPEIFDLPRQGTPTDVANVSRASVRLPDALFDE